MNRIAESELIINNDGSIFHLHLKPEDIADTIILVGDQDRVEVVSGYFEHIEVKKQNREFITHTGTYNGKRISVISTGIGTDNIDIVVNELDALVNIDLNTRLPKKEHSRLNLIRIGTSGALQADIPVDTPVISEWAIGFDGLLNYYANRNQVSNLEMEQAFKDFMNWNPLAEVPATVSLPQPISASAPMNCCKKLVLICVRVLPFQHPVFMALREGFCVYPFRMPISMKKYRTLMPTEKK